jgi:hypothetical protein
MTKRKRSPTIHDHVAMAAMLHGIRALSDALAAYAAEVHQPRSAIMRELHRGADWRVLRDLLQADFARFSLGNPDAAPWRAIYADQCAARPPILERALDQLRLAVLHEMAEHERHALTGEHPRPPLRIVTGDEPPGDAGGC